METKKIFIFLLLFLVFSSLAFAAPYWNYLTRSQADTFYCNTDGCVMYGDINMNNFSIIDANIVNATIIDVTQVVGEYWVNETGDTMSGDLIMASNRLTDVGELTMVGIAYTYDVIPTTTELYSLGNQSNWFEEIFVKTIHARDIFTGNLNATNINSTNIDSDDVNSNTVDVAENLTIGDSKMIKNGEGVRLII